MSVRAEIGSEPERLADRQVSLDREHRCSGALLLGEYLTTALVKDRIDTTDGVLRALDLDEVDGLLDTRRRCQARGVTDTTSRRNDLASTTVDGIGVKLRKSPSDTT